MATRFAEPEPWVKLADVLAEAAGVDPSREYDAAAVAQAKTMRGVRFDWAGKPTITWSMAAELLSSLKAEQARVLAEIEARAIEEHQRFRATLPSGVPAAMVPPGGSAVHMVMANDPMLRKARRESVLDHALANRDGAVFHPVGGEE